jgi:hypothetical protein
MLPYLLTINPICVQARLIFSYTRARIQPQCLRTGESLATHADDYGLFLVVLLSVSLAPGCISTDGT